MRPKFFSFTGAFIVILNPLGTAFRSHACPPTKHVLLTHAVAYRTQGCTDIPRAPPALILVTQAVSLARRLCRFPGPIFELHLTYSA